MGAIEKEGSEEEYSVSYQPFLLMREELEEEWVQEKGEV